MMTSLFSSFDPSSSLMMSSNWISTGIFCVTLTSCYWLTNNRIVIFINKMINTLHLEFKTLLGPSAHQGSTILFVALFTLIVHNNFMGLYPYIFTSTSHLVLALSLSLPLWVSFMLFGWVNHTKYMFAHLVPQSTPGVLMPFMVLIESISSMIRPGTLAVRLAANMIAGHLLMTLLGNQTASASSVILGILLMTQILLLTLESAVAIIQSYVFAVLSTLYASEITSH